MWSRKDVLLGNFFCKSSTSEGEHVRSRDVVAGGDSGKFSGIIYTELGPLERCACNPSGVSVIPRI